MARMYVHKQRGYQIHYRIYFPDGSERRKYKYAGTKGHALTLMQDIEQIERRSLLNTLTREDLLFAVRAKFITGEEAQRFWGAPVEIPTLGSLAETFLAQSQVENRPKTHATNTGRIQRILDYWGKEAPATDVTVAAIREYRQKRLRTIGAGTCNKEQIKLAQLLDLAVSAGGIKTNPARQIRPLKNSKERKPRGLTGEEIRILLDAAEKEKQLFLGMAYPVILTYLHTGMRRGELLNLEWQDVDIPARRITIQPAAEKNGYMTKTGKARVVGISRTLESILECLERSGRYVFGGDKPFISPDGITRSFRRLKNKAGLSPAITLHSLRHTYATHLMESGVNPRIVQERLGHRLFSTTWKYSHVLPSNEVVEDGIGY